MQESLKHAEKNLPKGLEKLYASGSAQFNAYTFEHMLSYIKSNHKGPITIVDLRRESHCFTNGWPCFWRLTPEFFDVLNKTPQEIEADEQKRMQDLLKSKKALAHVKKIKDIDKNEDMSKTEIIIKHVQLEKELVQAAGCTYLRIPVTDNHEPSAHAIDTFLQFYNEHKDSWMHFHCKEGRGRTTTFLALYDMIFNAKEVDFETIIKRQKLKGGADLFVGDASDYSHAQKHESAKKRFAVLKEFYQYCKENNDDFAKSFSSWLENSKKPFLSTIEVTSAAYHIPMIGKKNRASLL